jgi:hypothetical protein
MRINIGIFKALSHEAKVILSAVGSGLMTIGLSPSLLTALLTLPLVESLPIVLPVVLGTSIGGGSLFNMNSKKDAGKE